MKGKLLIGLTLIELIVVVAIISLLVAVVQPSYRHNFSQDKTNLAKAYLLDVSTRQHLYLRRYGVYADNLPLLGTAPSKKLASKYRVHIEVDQQAQAANFVVRAEPRSSKNGSSLGILTLNHLGQTSDNWHD